MSERRSADGQSLRWPAMRRSLAVSLAVLLMTAGGLVPAAARGDGDPASDVLVSQSLFMPYDTYVSSARQAQLEGLLRSAQRSGMPIRVAMIPSEYDLGSVGVLWRNPRTYARFLGIELSLTYTGRLLVAMPGGFGINWPHHSTAAAYKALGSVPIGAGGAGLVGATELAIHRLAAAAGVRLSSAAAAPRASSSARSSASSSSSDSSASGTIVLVIGVLLALALLAGGGVLVLRRRRASATVGGDRGVDRGGRGVDRHGADRGGAQAPPLPRATDSLARLRWSVAGLVVVCIGLGVAVLALTGPRRAAGSGVRTSADVEAGGDSAGSAGSPGSADSTGSSGSDTAGTSDTGGSGSAGSSGGEGPIAWPAGQRPAPDFQLTDQDGQTVSPADYRGKPVIVTFIDPLCRNLCPLAGKVLSEADEDLPAGQRPPIIAVSVDIYADTRADLHEDYQRWSLTPQWQWAVGSPGRLASVWKRYYAEVEVETKHIAGTTVHYITHSEMAYLIDGRGDERRLFTWPYTPEQIDAAVRGISQEA